MKRRMKNHVVILSCMSMLISSTLLTVVSPMVVETRRSILTTWNPTKPSTTVLGWALERRDSVKERYQITVAWTHSEEEEKDNSSDSKRDFATTTIELPYLAQVDSLASSLWPASLAGSILFQSPAWRQQLYGKHVLELGSGVGLAGLAAAAAAAAAATFRHDESSAVPDNSRGGGGSGSTWLTDYDPQAVELLQTCIEMNQELFVSSSSSSSSSPPPPTQHQQQLVFAQRLDWRDPPEMQQLVSPSTPSSSEENAIQIALGTDVCYYYHLLRPLMDTIQRKMEPWTSPSTGMESSSCNNDNNSKLLCLVGQANRQSLWDMYHNIGNGCYNQVTDQRDPPWPGTTLMLLYQMYLGTWVTAASDDDDTTIHDDDDDSDLTDIASLQPLDGILPMAAVLHTNQDKATIESSSSTFSLLRSYDHIATKFDEEAQMKSF